MFPSVTCHIAGEHDSEAYKIQAGLDTLHTIDTTRVKLSGTLFRTPKNTVFSRNISYVYCTFSTFVGTPYGC
jgi:hypothetical protein